MGNSRGRRSSSIRDSRRRLLVSEPVGRVVGSNLVLYCVVLALYDEV